MMTNLASCKTLIEMQENLTNFDKNQEIFNQFCRILLVQADVGYFGILTDSEVGTKLD